MSRVNRPDTLFTELREIQRRLRLLEAARGTTTTAAMASFAVADGWTGRDRFFTRPGPVRLVVEIRADDGTTGQVRVLADGVQAGDELEATTDVVRHVVDVTAEGDPAELAVESLRSDGSGVVHVAAFVVR